MVVHTFRIVTVHFKLLTDVWCDIQYNLMFCFSFIQVYSVVNSYIVCYLLVKKMFNGMKAQPPKVKLHEIEISITVRYWRSLC